MIDPGSLDSLDDAALDGLPFGVIRLGPTGAIERYNRNEATRAGTQRWRVLGRNFFRDVLGRNGAVLAEQVQAVAPGAQVCVPFSFRRFAGVDDVVIDVSRSTCGHVYLCIHPAPT